MFGLIAKPPSWVFAGFGKHPLAGDFIRVGTETPLLQGFSAWMDLGFSKIPEELGRLNDVAWNFLALGPGEKLILGHVKSSTDRLGRSHPLLLLGEGKPREIFSDNWDLWPFFCETAWKDLAVVSGRAVRSIRDFERHLSRVSPPSATLRSCIQRRERMKHMELRIPGSPSRHPSDFINKMNNVEGLCRMDCFSVCMDVGHPDNVLEPVAKLLGLLKTRARIEPRAVFIGGRAGSCRTVVFRRSLQPADVHRLWNREEKGNHER